MNRMGTTISLRDLEKIISILRDINDENRVGLKIKTVIPYYDPEKLEIFHLEMIPLDEQKSVLTFTYSESTYGLYWDILVSVTEDYLTVTERAELNKVISANI